MAGHNIQIGETIGPSWEIVKNNLLFLWAVMIAAGVVGASPTLVSESWLLDIIGFVLSSAMTMGAIRITLRLVDGARPTFGDLFTCFHLLPQYILAFIFNGFVVAVGFILLIVPGIILAIMFFFYDYFIVDQASGPIQSLKQSSEATTGVKGQLFGFFLRLLGLNLLGLLLLVVGLLVTIPISMIATAMVYRRLVPATEPTEL